MDKLEKKILASLCSDKSSIKSFFNSIKEKGTYWDALQITAEKFEISEVEKKWSKQAKIFLNLMANKYVEFFSMFNRISQVHVFILFSLSLINKETELSFETKKVFEKIISMLHTPIDIKDFHNPDFNNFDCIGETKASILEIIKKYSDKDLTLYIDFSNPKTMNNINELITLNRIKKVDEFKYEVDQTRKFEVAENVETL